MEVAFSKPQVPAGVFSCTPAEGEHLAKTKRYRPLSLYKGRWANMMRFVPYARCTLNVLKKPSARYMIDDMGRGSVMLDDLNGDGWTDILFCAEGGQTTSAWGNIQILMYNPAVKKWKEAINVGTYNGELESYSCYDRVKKTGKNKIRIWQDKQDIETGEYKKYHVTYQWDGKTFRFKKIAERKSGK